MRKTWVREISGLTGWLSVHYSVDRGHGPCHIVVNAILEDEVWAALAGLRQGERSRFINRAIAKELLRIHAARMPSGNWKGSVAAAAQGNAEQWNSRGAR
jgi:hypothetical protein